LHGDFQAYTVTLTADIDWLRVEYGLVLIQISNERLDTAFIVEGMGSAVTFILNDNT
jgi:hypothetical protein